MMGRLRRWAAALERDPGCAALAWAIILSGFGLLLAGCDLP